MDATSKRLPLLLGFLAAVGPLSTDMYLPAFPAMEQSYGADPGAAQVTLASWFVGLAFGQLTQGSLTDRFGRRAPLLVGLVVYTLASVGCALAPNLTILTGLRFVAAFGGSASMVIPRAVIRDLADGHAAARLMSQLMLVMGAAPILAPGLGGAMLLVASWRLIFWFAAAHGLISILLVRRFLPETLPRARRMHLGIVGLLSRYVVVVRDRVFLVYALTGSFVMFGLFAYLSGSSPVYIGLYRLSAAESGALVGFCATGFIMGSQLAPRLLPRLGLGRVLRLASRAFLFGTVVMCGFAFAGGFGVWSVVLPAIFCTTCMGVVLPNASVGALSRHAGNAGSASAVMGMLQFLLAAISGSLVGLLTDGTARPMAALMLVGAACATLADRFRAKDPIR